MYFKVGLTTQMSSEPHNHWEFVSYSKINTVKKYYYSFQEWNLIAGKNGIKLPLIYELILTVFKIEHRAWRCDRIFFTGV